jgi:Mn-dependent DtxR family transcriptional regulator
MKSKPLGNTGAQVLELALGTWQHRAGVESLLAGIERGAEQQACKFEHILSPEAADKICALLGHRRPCPHGAPIPPGLCCGRQADAAGIIVGVTSREQ